MNDFVSNLLEDNDIEFKVSCQKFNIKNSNKKNTNRAKEDDLLNYDANIP